MRCASCGRAMQTTSIPSSTGKLHHYYRCPRRVRDGKEGCENGKNPRADYAEPLIWKAVSELLKNPERLRVGLQAMIEGERSWLKGNPEQEAEVWLKKLNECSRKRAAYQDQQAAGLMTLDELSARLAELENARLLAEWELSKLRNVQEKIRTLEHDAGALLASYEHTAPEEIDALSAKERHHVYKIIWLEVLAHPDGALEAIGDVPHDVSTLNSTATTRASSTNARLGRTWPRTREPCGACYARTRTLSLSR
jgi:Recombinase zinc beta ribbon domain